MKRNEHAQSLSLLILLQFSITITHLFRTYRYNLNKAQYFIIVIVIVTVSAQKVIYLRKCICALSRIDTTYWYVIFCSQNVISYN